MNSDWLLIIIVPMTAWSAWVLYYRARHGEPNARFLLGSRIFMLAIFGSAGLAALGIIPLDAATRIFLLRLGWLSQISVESIIWIKRNRNHRLVAESSQK